MYIPSYNCVTILTSFQPKVENFRRGEGTFFGRGISKMGDRRQNFQEWRGNKKRGRPTFFEKIGGGNLPRRAI